METVEAQAPVARRAQFEAMSPLRAELTRRVDAYFLETGLDEKGGLHAILKAAILLTWAVASYVFLVFYAQDLVTAALSCVSLGLAMAGIGFAVMHDGNHGATSHRWWVNRLAGSTIDLLGGSSYFWHQKHDILHHTFTNIDGLDEDIDSRPFLRMTPGQPRHFFHRFQHFYEIFLLAFFAPKWLFVDDFRTWIQGRIAGTRIPRPRGWDAVQLVIGKLALVGWAIVLPLMRHAPLDVLLGFVLVGWTLGATLGIVFQLAHAIEETEFHELPAPGTRMAQPFFEHQIATTSDFAQNNRLLSWFVGGLNYQVEHHLFPRISHRHYPAIARITRQVCEEQGVRYHSHATVLEALRSHFGRLKRLGAAA